MNDKELIDIVARIWVEHGGDADGIAYCWRKIMERIKEIEKEKADA